MAFKMIINQSSNSNNNADEIDLKDGWLPAHIKYQNGDALVELVRLPECKIKEKFLHWDLNKCTEKVYITMKKLQKSHLPDAILSGQIFHLSRVGSTLVTEMLRVLDDYIVLSEPQCLSDIFLDPFGAPEEVKLNSIRTLLAVFSSVLGGKKIIIKWSSWKILHIDMLNKLYSDVPACFVVRDPVEVLVALAGKPPGWMKRKKMVSMIEKDGGKEKSLYWASMNNALCGKVDYYSELSFPDYAAGILAEMCEAAASTSSPLIILEYIDIYDKVPSVLAAAFSINPSHQETEKMRAVCSRDAKTGGENAFKPDSVRKQVEATPMIRAAAEAIVKPAYLKLLRAHEKC